MGNWKLETWKRLRGNGQFSIAAVALKNTFKYLQIYGVPGRSLCFQQLIFKYIHVIKLLIIFPSPFHSPSFYRNL